MKFWCVYHDGAVWKYCNGDISKHISLDRAIKEAKELAKMYPNSEFYVLEAIGFAKKTDVEWKNLE